MGSSMHHTFSPVEDEAEASQSNHDPAHRRETRKFSAAARHPHFDRCFSISSPNVLPKTEPRPRLRLSNSDSALLELEASTVACSAKMSKEANSGHSGGDSAEDYGAKADPLLTQLSSFSMDPDGCGEHKSKGQSVVGKLKSLMMLRRSKSTGDLLATYTYICTASRMMHHSHGMDASIIDRF
jgi:hypothetical protein